MNRNLPQILVCTDGSEACVRIRGRADVSVSVGFKELLSRLHEHHFKHYELELSECPVMDSTFLGVLCGFAQRREAERAGDQSRTVLTNANERVSGLLESLGVAEMFDFREGARADRGPCEPLPPQANKQDRESLHATSLEAHRTLMSLNPNNVPKFKDLTEFLAEDLKKIRKNTTN